ncbi:hypothetical protein FCM35_KLT00656 [Carex littledalei]|uniref:DUF674 domain-containing protein n=1 Tax=Carex littledalei TaxID=544730 RepID=A0A833RLE3_9POAL|nr:hypothetical protein FCM35_KLT00656 [Carex littledalei]
MGFELKLLIEKKSQKVLFAEVGKDVVDFLFSLLSLPIGSVAKLITEESILGPLRNTYCSWEQLDHSFLSSSGMTANKLIIPEIFPTSSSSFDLLLSSASPVPTVKEKVYACNCNCKFTYEYGTYCKSCNFTRKDFSYVGSSVTKETVKRDGYIKSGFTYAIMDDLSMVPMTPLASIELLDKLGFQDLSLLEKKTVSLDVQQGLELLKTSFSSKNVLTDMFLAKKKEGH